MNVKSSLLKALAEAGEDYISGGALAEKLGVSRNAVWKAVKALENDGFTVESAAAKGYRLSPDSNRLSSELISARLTAGSLGGNIAVYDCVESTNITAKELASEGASHGTVVVAETQTMGKGRLGRSFVSPSGKGLYMSVIIRPDFGIETSSLITSAAAVAAAQAVEELCGCGVNIKWVNDLYLSGKKICGILTEASLGLEMKSLDYAVIGIGINVLSDKESFGGELSGIVTSVEDETGVKPDRNALCAAVLNRLEDCLGRIESRDYLAEYRRRELLTGNNITANVGSQKIAGKAVGIDDNANLIVELPDGSVRHLSSGEANLCRITQSY